MDEEDPVPTARMHWTRLVLGRGHPAIIIIVLAVVGAAVCWFSLQKISMFTQTPTRYTLDTKIDTNGCADRRLRLDGDIGSFDSSYLHMRFLDDDEKPIFVGGCRARTIVLSSNLPLEPVRFGFDSPSLIGVTGVDPNRLTDEENGDADAIPMRDALERFQATIVDDDLRAIRPDSTESGPSFSMRVEEDPYSAGVNQLRIHYEVSFPDNWQPTHYTVTFVVPENIRTYFDLLGIHFDERLPESQDGPETAERSVIPNVLDMSVSFWTDEVLLVRGLMSDSGDAVGVDGVLRFGIENSDAESRRESGNVRYSAILGIGIALIVEAFVILLALGVRGLASRLGIGGTPVVPSG